MIGLKRRLTYDELLDKLDVDPIKKYPDRRATVIENSHYMSQLASGFREVLEQHDRVMKEKTKALLLQDAASTSGLSHVSWKSLSSFGLNKLFANAPAQPTFFSPNLSSDSGGESAESAISNTRSTYKALATTLSNQIGAQQEVIQRQRDIMEGEQGRRHEAALSVAEDLIRRQQNRERQYEDELALRDYDMMQQEQMHQQQLQNTRQQASALLAGIYDQGIHRMIGGPISGSSSSGLIGGPIAGSSSSSSSSALPPMRLAIQDTPASLIAQNYMSESDEEEKPVVSPGKFQPRLQDVQHLFRAKEKRQPISGSGLDKKIYLNNADEWMKEKKEVIQKQLSMRPGSAPMFSKTAMNKLTKEQMVFYITEFDKKS